MKNVTYVGLCWAMCLSLVAVALGQQQLDPPAAPAAGGQPAVGQSAAQGGLFGGQQQNLGQTGIPNQQSALPAPGESTERSLVTGSYNPGSGQELKNDQAGKPRAELGVWLVESEGPGVTIQRITSGSAAEQAGLQTGDIILQVNGKGAASPLETAQMIRQIPIGERGTLTVWRDGNQHQRAITMQQARERVREMLGNVIRDDSYEVGFRGENDARGSEATGRITRLEEKIATLTQQLSAIQQKLTELRSQHSGTQPASFTDSAHSATSTDAAPQNNPLPPAASPAAPPPGFGATEEKKDAAIPAAPPASDPAAAPPAPAAEKPATDPFGTASEPAKANEPKAEEKKEESKEAVDDLFK